MVISIKDISSTTALLKFRIPKELKLILIIAERSHVFNFQTIENERLGVADVAPFVKTIFLIKLRWSLDTDCKVLLEQNPGI